MCKSSSMRNITNASNNRVGPNFANLFCSGSFSNCCINQLRAASKVLGTQRKTHASTSSSLIILCIFTPTPSLETKLWAHSALLCPPTRTYWDLSPLPHVLTQLTSNDCLHGNSYLTAQVSLCPSRDKGSDLGCRIKSSLCKPLATARSCFCDSIYLADQLYSATRTDAQLGAASTAILKLFRTTATSLTVWELRNESTSSDMPLWGKAFFSFYPRRS